MSEELKGSYRQFYDARYLAADDLPDAKEIELLISKVTLEKSQLDGKRLVSLHFEGKKKMMAVNITNAKTITKKLGTSDVQKWVGKKITIHRTTCKAFGDPNMPCIRVI